MSNFSQIWQAIKMRRKTLNVAFVEVLASLEEIDISLLPLAPLNDKPPPLFRLIASENFSIAIVNGAVRIPEVSLNPLRSRIVKVDEYGILAGDPKAIRDGVSRSDRIAIPKRRTYRANCECLRREAPCPSALPGVLVPIAAQTCGKISVLK